MSSEHTVRLSRVHGVDSYESGHLSQGGWRKALRKICVSNWVLETKRNSQW